MKKQYSFLDENCAAGITTYESLPTNQGTFQDVYCKQKKNKKKHYKRLVIKNPMK
jgi:hypothetical protein